MHNLKHINKATQYVFMVEGSAEKFIIETLISENKIIDVLMPNTKYNFLIWPCYGYPNLNCSTFVEKSKNILNEGDLKNLHIVVVGDSLYKNKVIDNFWAKCKCFDDKFKNRITFVSINPEPEIILLTKIGVDTSKIKNSNEMWKKISSLSISKSEIKGYDFWEEHIKRRELSEIIKRTNFRKKDNEKEICLKEILK